MLGWAIVVDAGIAPPVEEVVETSTRSLRRDVSRTFSPPPATEDTTLVYCPARLVVTTTAGQPFQGEARIGTPSEDWVMLDSHGEADWTTRKCDATGNLHLRSESEPPFHSRVPFADVDTVEVVVPTWGEAFVRPVDETGAPVRAMIRPGRRLDDGSTHVEGRGESITLRVFARGEHGGRATIPLDGKLHEVEVPRDRIVQLRLLCDQCTGRIVCTSSRKTRGLTCTETDEEGVLDCQCPPDDATLWMRSPDGLRDWVDHVQPLTFVPADTNALTIDARGELASVRATYSTDSSDAYIGATLHRPGSEGYFVPEDTEFGDKRGLEVDGLLPGAWELRLRWDKDVETVLAFELLPGQRLDLGTLAP